MIFNALIPTVRTLGASDRSMTLDGTRTGTGTVLLLASEP